MAALPVHEFEPRWSGKVPHRLVGLAVRSDPGSPDHVDTPAYAELAGHWAFYPQRIDECRVDDERVEPNEGGFYGGWITANVTGPA